MTAEANLSPTKETTNRYRLTVLLIQGGTQTLKNILLDLLFDFHLQRKKDDIQNEVGTGIYQQQFGQLFPGQGNIPRLQGLDETLLTFVYEKVLNKSLGAGVYGKPFMIEKIVEFLDGKGFSDYLELKQSHLQSLAKQRRKYMNSLYQPVTNICRKVRVTDLDISLLSFILLNAFDLKPSSGVWNQDPLDSHKEIADDILRLRKWRNYIFHGKEAGIEDESYNEIWKGITALLQRRLSDFSSMRFNDWLQKATLESSNFDRILNEWFIEDTDLLDALKSLEIQIGSGNAELKTMIENKFSREAVVESMVRNLTEKIDGLVKHLDLEIFPCTSYCKMCEESVKKYVRKTEVGKLPTDYMKSQVDGWKKRDLMFCETEAYHTVCGKLEQENIVTITGAPGSGKKAIARHAALDLQEKGYHLYPVESPGKITGCFCESLKQVFCIDNPLGIYQVAGDELAKWERCNEGIQNLLKKQNFKLVVTVSPQMLKALEKLSLVLTRCVVNITSQGYTLKEKSKIFKKYCPSVNPTYKVLNCRFDCFPLLCFILGSDLKTLKERENLNIFESPFRVVKQTLGEIQERNTLQFCGMLLCAVIDKLHEDLFDRFFSPVGDVPMMSNIGKIDKILKHMGDMSKKSVKKELDLICDIYVQNIGGSYIFIHPLFRDIVLYLVGKQSNGFIFQFFPGSVIREKVIISNSAVPESNGQCLIAVKDTPNVWKMLRARVVTDLRESKYEDAFMNSHLSNNSLAEMLMQEIKSMDDKQRRSCDDRGKTMLHWSVSQSMVTLTSYLLDTGLDVNSLDKNRCTAIFYACSHEILSILIEHQAHLNILNVYGETALLRNLSRGHDLVQMLLDHDADVNLHGEYHETALVRAANYNDFNLVKMLTDHGADVDGRRKEGDTALVKAAYHNNGEMVKLLIEHNANVDLHGRYGDTALVLATNHDNKEIVELLLGKSADANLHGEKYEKVVVIDRSDMLTNLLQAGLYKMKVKNLLYGKENIFRATSIVKAVTKNNIEMVKLLLEHGANPNLNGAGPHSALVKAAYYNNLEIAQLLLHHGADVNLKCTGFRYVDTAIVNAAFHNNTEMVELFLNHLADVNFRGESRDAAVVKTAYRNNIELANVLLEKGADVNLHGKYSDSAIVRAAYHNNTEMVRIFLKFGAKPNSCGELSDPALGKASHKNNMEIMDMLIENGVDINKHRFGTNTPITNAVYHRNIVMVQKLLDNGADVNLKQQNILVDEFRSIATDRSNTCILKKILLKFGDSIYVECEGRDEDIKSFVGGANNLRQKEGIRLRVRNRKTALMQAAYNNDLEIVEVLLKHKADVNFLSEKFDPPIVSAARCNNLEMVKLLLRHKADPNLHIKTRDSAVVHAAHHSNMQMMKRLIDHGADVNKCSVDRDSALVRATGNNHANMAMYLISHGSNVNYRGTNRDTALIKAAKHNNMNLVKLLLSKGADVNLKNGCCSNALSKAVNNRNMEMIELFLDKGADINISCDKCDTFLARAVRFNNERMVNLLLKQKANVNTYLEKRNPPIALAAERNNKDLVKCLLDHGADVNTGPKHLDSALVLAAHKNNIEIVKLLLDVNADVNACARPVEEWGRRGFKKKTKQSSEYCSALAKAVNHNNLEMITLLIDRGANICEQRHVHEKAMISAVKNNSIAIVKLLLDKGMYLKDEVKTYILFDAIDRHNKNIVSLLLDGGISVNLTSKWYNTPLATAIRLQDPEMTDILLCAGAKNTVNDTSGLRDTALVSAAYNNNTELVKLLLDLGADVNLHRTVSVKRSPEYSIWPQSEDIESVNQMQKLINSAHNDSKNTHDSVWTMARQLLYFYPSVHLHDIGNTALGEATYHDNEEMVKLLLDHGALVNLHGVGDSPLVNTVNNNNVHMLQLLIEHGAFVNDIREYRDTAIVRAVRHNNMNIAQVLIHNGADVNRHGLYTDAALYTAVYFNHADMAELLLEHGAGVTYFDGRCNVVLSKARHHQNTRLVKMLQKYGATDTCSTCNVPLVITTESIIVAILFGIFSYCIMWFCTAMYEYFTSAVS